MRRLYDKSYNQRFQQTKQNTTVSTQLEAKIITQAAWNGLMFSSAIIIWLHFRRAFLHYYGKQHQVK